MPTELTKQNLGEPPASGTGKYAVHAAGFLRNWSVKIHFAPSRRKSQHQERNAYLIRIALFSIFRRSAGLPAALTSYVNSPCCFEESKPARAVPLVLRRSARSLIGTCSGASPVPDFNYAIESGI